MSTHRPLVSVVTPCLDPGGRLRRCLESVAIQTYAPLEHIVVDGGSSDGTLELLRRADLHWISEPDRGQTDAIGKGFMLARGELLGWLNADDELLPDAIAKAVEALLARPDAGFVYGDCELVENGERRVRRSAPIMGPESFYVTNPVAQPGALVQRAALEQAGGMDPSFSLAMDFDLWLRLADAGFHGIYVPETLARFEITDNSKTGSVPWSDFLREEALALGKSGRIVEASLKLGAASAWAARSPSRSRRLAPESRAAISWARSRGIDVRPAQVRAGAALTASTLGESRSRVAHLLRPEIWTTPAARRRAMARIVHRLSGARGGRPRFRQAE